MHEVSLIHALFDQVERASAPYPELKVRKLTVRIGELAGVDAELFRTAFEGCRHERGHGTATLELALEPAAWRCALCDSDVPIDAPLTCPRCEGVAKLVAGGALILDRVELEAPDV